MIELHIPLQPVPWQAPKKGKYTFYDPKEKEKRCVRFYLREQYQGEPLDEFVVLLFSFNFKFPKNLTKKKREMISNGQLFPTRSDCTNMQKLYEDCLKGIVIKDDRKVTKIFSRKMYADKDSIFIEVFTIQELLNKKQFTL